MVRYLFYTIGDLTYQSPLVVLFEALVQCTDILVRCFLNDFEMVPVHCYWYRFGFT